MRHWKKLLIRLGLLGIASAQVLPVEILPTEKEDKRASYTMESGEKYKVPDGTKFEVTGEFRLKKGSKFEMGNKPLFLRGGVYIESGATIVFSDAKVFISGTVYVEPEIYDYEIAPLIYSGRTLIQHPREDAEFSGSGWLLPLYRPSITFKNVEFQ